MAKSLLFKIVTPERVVFEDSVDAVILPTMQGEITILPSHIPLVSLLRPGAMRVKKGSDETSFAVSSGVIEVSDNKVVVLADTAERADELEEEKIARARDEARRLMTEKRHDAEGFAEATAMLERELARMKVVQRHRRRAPGGGAPTIPTDQS